MMKKKHIKIIIIFLLISFIVNLKAESSDEFKEFKEEKIILNNGYKIVTGSDERFKIERYYKKDKLIFEYMIGDNDLTIYDENGEIIKYIKYHILFKDREAYYYKNNIFKIIYYSFNVPEKIEYYNNDKRIKTIEFTTLSGKKDSEYFLYSDGKRIYLKKYGFDDKKFFLKDPTDKTSSESDCLKIIEDNESLVKKMEAEVLTIEDKIKSNLEYFDLNINKPLENKFLLTSFEKTNTDTGYCLIWWEDKTKNKKYAEYYYKNEKISRYRQYREIEKFISENNNIKHGLSLEIVYNNDVIVSYKSYSRKTGNLDRYENEDEKYLIKINYRENGDTTNYYRYDKVKRESVSEEYLYMPNTIRKIYSKNKNGLEIEYIESLKKKGEKEFIDYNINGKYKRDVDKNADGIK